MMAIQAFIVKDEVLLEEGKNLGVDSAIGAPVRVVERSVVFVGSVRNSVFVQLPGEGLIGIDMVEVSILARPVELESS